MLDGISLTMVPVSSDLEPPQGTEDRPGARGSVRATAGEAEG